MFMALVAMIGYTRATLTGPRLLRSVISVTECQRAPVAVAVCSDIQARLESFGSLRSQASHAHAADMNSSCGRLRLKRRDISKCWTFFANKRAY